ncbi:flagellar export protein FliJ [uncultured Thermanaerothrix sp.]|uniref:flagellar export protein FliJ n=1 Tax=uncultured Thermanaerothrix sp. TaxID=1195149 RepID=UPI002628433B|nr:flagellar export protein FliJ [uncultured Thermanaerothrix sp.]
MPPKFSLQSVLDVRQRRVEALEVELGRLLQEQRKGEELLEGLRSLENFLFARIQSQQVGEVDVFALDQLHHELMRVQDHIERTREALEMWRQRVAAKRQELVQARQDAEILEALREKELARYREEMAQVESRLLDDLYISRAFRRQGER